MLRRLRESTFGKFAEAKGKIQYPPNHNPVLKVPEGGSSCSNCKYIGVDGKTCKSQYFILFMGTNRLPFPANKMCSDWWEPKGDA